jgi:hypothetical protein
MAFFALSRSSGRGCGVRVVGQVVFTVSSHAGRAIALTPTLSRSTGRGRRRWRVRRLSSSVRKLRSLVRTLCSRVTPHTNKVAVPIK